MDTVGDEYLLGWLNEFPCAVPTSDIGAIDEDIVNGDLPPDNEPSDPSGLFGKDGSDDTDDNDADDDCTGEVDTSEDDVHEDEPTPAKVKKVKKARKKTARKVTRRKSRTVTHTAGEPEPAVEDDECGITEQNRITSGKVVELPTLNVDTDPKPTKAKKTKPVSRLTVCYGCEPFLQGSKAPRLGVLLLGSIGEPVAQALGEESYWLSNTFQRRDTLKAMLADGDFDGLLSDLGTLIINKDSLEERELAGDFIHWAITHGGYSFVAR